MACRYGGEELAVILPHATLEQTRLRAEKLREATKRLHVTVRQQLLGEVTVSVGVAAFPTHGKTIEHLIAAADRALYQAKANGRDCVVVAQEPVRTGTSDTTVA
jgi:diguanylate cyclase (GGDEF)-like protein